ncbi:MAG: hypothetical protein OXR82_20395 [Gammaproteobacteria bacterium]|nr:hypothetical protein [Gammaproteobacteria bacterium]MDE0260733.1 hypothetical protein [Gammaproteobacteria bacterium]
MSILAVIAFIGAIQVVTVLRRRRNRREAVAILQPVLSQNISAALAAEPGTELQEVEKLLEMIPALLAAGGWEGLENTARIFGQALNEAVRELEVEAADEFSRMKLQMIKRAMVERGVYLLENLEAPSDKEASASHRGNHDPCTHVPGSADLGGF